MEIRYLIGYVPNTAPVYFSVPTYRQQGDVYLRVATHPKGLMVTEVNNEIVTNTLHKRNRAGLYKKEVAALDLRLMGMQVSNESVFEQAINKIQ